MVTIEIDSIVSGEARPLRIITFSPGLTSIVFGMGLGDQVTDGAELLKLEA